MSYEKLNLADGDTLKAEHLSHMEKGIEEADKVIVTEGGDTLTWDGNTEGLVSAGGILYKISDAIVTMDDLSNGGEAVLNDTHYSVPAENAEEMATGVIAFFDAFVAFVSEVGVGVEVDGISFPEAGVYFASPDSGICTQITIPGYTGFAKKQVNPEYLPEFSWKSLKDKPFGDIQTVFLDEAELALGDGFAEIPLPLGGMPLVGSVVTVEINGEIYEQACATIQNVIFYVGNLALVDMGDDTGESYCVCWIPSYGMGAIGVSNTALTHCNVKITGTTRITIPNEFAPKATRKVYIADISPGGTNRYLYRGATLTEKLTFAELTEMLNGNHVQLSLGEYFFFTPLYAGTSTGVYGIACVYFDGRYETYYTAEYTP